MDGRVKKSIKNIQASIIRKSILSITAFITRTVFIYYLGIEILGTTSVFASILTILSLAELGIGEAVSFSLYKPLKDRDMEKVDVIMLLIKKCYHIIFFIIIILGVAFIPFLPKIIGESIKIENIYTIYLLYIMFSASSYLMAYKRILLQADQKKFKEEIAQTIIGMIYNLIQIILLIIFQNYILFLSFQILYSISENIIVSNIVKREYPKKNNEKKQLSHEEKNKIFKNFFALSLQKLQSVVFESIDNIIISVYMGTITVGFLSNFKYIIDNIAAFAITIFAAIAGSVGNVIVSQNQEYSQNVFLKINFATFWLYSFCSICLFNLLNPFISLIYGNEYSISYINIMLLVLNFYVLGMRQSVTSFKNAYGLYWQDRYKPMLNIVLNVSLSLILVKPLGITGVLIATCACYLFINSWIEPLVLFKYGFNSSSKEYFNSYIKNLLLTVLLSFLFWILFKYLSFDNLFIDLIIKGSIMFFATNGIYYLLFKNSNELDYFLNIVKDKLKKKKTNYE